MSEYFNDEFPQGLGKCRPKRATQPKIKCDQKKIGLIIVGDTSVGKSTYVDALQNDPFYGCYDPTCGIEKIIYSFETEKGGVEAVFRIYDVGASNKNTNIQWPKKSRIDCALLMFDLTSTQSYKSIPDWYDKITKLYPGILIVLCGNKLDVKERKVRPKFIKYNKTYNVPYYDISSKNTTNIDKPLMFFVNRIKERRAMKKEMEYN